MNFQSRSSPEEEEPTINVTPLMDIVFLLIIFLVVTTTFRTYSGIVVNLPKAEADRAQREERTRVAVLTRRGEIFLDGRPVVRKKFLDTLRSLQAASPAPVFVVEADEMAEHGRVVELMDAARKVGISRLAIATREKEIQAAEPAGVPRQPEP